MIRKIEYSISNTSKTFSEDSGLTEKLQSSQEGIMATHVQNGVDMLNSILTNSFIST